MNNPDAVNAMTMKYNSIGPASLGVRLHQHRVEVMHHQLQLVKELLDQLQASDELEDSHPTAKLLGRDRGATVDHPLADACELSLVRWHGTRKELHHGRPNGWDLLALAHGIEPPRVDLHVGVLDRDLLVWGFIGCLHVLELGVEEPTDLLRVRVVLLFALRLQQSLVEGQPIHLVAVDVGVRPALEVVLDGIRGTPWSKYS